MWVKPGKLKLPSLIASLLRSPNGYTTWGWTSFSPGSRRAVPLLAQSLECCEGFSITPIRRFAIPDHRLDSVFRQTAPPILVHDAQIPHAAHISGIRSLTPPDHGRSVVFRQTAPPAVVHEAKFTHAGRIAPIRRLAIPDRS